MDRRRGREPSTACSSGDAHGLCPFRQDIRDLRDGDAQEFASLRTVMFTFGGGIIVALIGVIAAILARGA